MFHEVGMTKERGNIKCCTVESDDKIKVVCKDRSAAMYVLTQSNRMSPRYWREKNDGAAIYLQNGGDATSSRTAQWEVDDGRLHVHHSGDAAAPWHGSQRGAHGRGRGCGGLVVNRCGA